MEPFVQELSLLLFNGTLLKEVQETLNELNTPAKSNFLTALQKSIENIKIGDYNSSHDWAQVAMEWSWEQLHAMHWKDLPISYRRLYAYTAILDAMVYCKEEKYSNAMETIDRGLLLGAPVLNDSLQRWGSAVSRVIRETNYKRKEQPELDDKTSISSLPTKKLRNDAELHSVDSQSLLQSVITNVEVLHSPPSLLHFKEEYMKKGRPVLIKGCISHWPAMSTRQWRYNLEPSWLDTDLFCFNFL